MCTHVSAACVRRKKKWWVGRRAHESSSSRQSTARSARRPRCSSACLLTHQGHMRAPAVGVKGPRRGSRGAAAVQRERRRRVDRAAVRSRCGDARCRVRGGAPRRRRRVRGGSAERTIVHVVEGVAFSSRRARAFVWEPSSSQDARRTSQDVGVPGHQPASPHTKCGGTRRCVSAQILPKTLRNCLESCSGSWDTRFCLNAIFFTSRRRRCNPHTLVHILHCVAACRAGAILYQ